MTIDEAIIHCEEVAIRQLKNENNAKCVQCGEEHVQLAKWLKELKDYKSREYVVEVIRCRYCKHFMSPHACSHDDGMITARSNGFCSYGERKEE